MVKVQTLFLPIIIMLTAPQPALAQKGDLAESYLLAQHFAEYKNAVRDLRLLKASLFGAYVAGSAAVLFTGSLLASRIMGARYFQKYATNANPLVGLSARNGVRTELKLSALNTFSVASATYVSINGIEALDRIIA